MPFTAYQLHNSFASDANTGSQYKTVIRYLVNAPADYMSHWVTNRSHVDIEGAPNLGDPSPTNGLLIARSMKAEDLGDQRNSILTVEFTSLNHSGTGTLFNIPIVDGSMFTYSVGYEIVEVSIPCAYRTSMAIQKDTEDELINYWAIGSDYKRRESRTVFSVQWKLPGPPNMSTINQFAAQNNKIHQIGGVKYLFKMGSITPEDNQFYIVSASWTRDYGTEQIESDGKSLVLFPGNQYTDSGDGNTYTFEFVSDSGGGPLDGFMRNPYTRIWVVPTNNPYVSNEPPKAVLIQEYDEDLFAWQQFPGIPNL